MKIRHRAVPEAILRDRLRGSWILVLPASEFLADAAKETGGQVVPDQLPRRAYSGFDEEDRTFLAAEILTMSALAAVLTWMLWSLASF